MREDDRTSGLAALLWAAHWNDLATADLLIRAGADANAANDFRTTPLSEACTNGSAVLVDRLLRAGANPNTPIANDPVKMEKCGVAVSASKKKRAETGRQSEGHECGTLGGICSSLHS